ncbi:MAG TPA: N-formylglutamate amidohydrolase [Bdellovibrionales bacterium]|nr:N-formylglutamate amidohydrolase [Bdellovibrionales bacterium]
MKPFFLSIPHSGERIPAEATWLEGLPEPVVMCDVDRYVDRLYAPVVKELKLTCVQTQWHRYVVDLNRLPDDVDADSVEGDANPSGKFTTGLHWVKTTRGAPLMAKPISRKLHDTLVARYFEPFHSDVRDTYSFFKDKGAKEVYHLDAHSMPSMGTKAHRDPGEKRASIVVSDWEGKSCKPEFRDLVVKAFGDQAGLDVKLNWPYLGGRVTQTYGKPDQGQHAIQVEISRSLYMDEESKAFLPDKAAELIPRLSTAITFIQSRIEDI